MTRLTRCTKHRVTELAPSPLVVDITPLKRQPGTQRPFKESLAPPAGVVLESAEVTATQLHLDLQMEMRGEEIVAQGTITVEWNGPCRRCLEHQDGSTEFKIQEIFQRPPVEGETYYLDKDDVDLEPMVRESVLLNMPVAPLCSLDCAGPDPERFPTSVESDEVPDGAEPPADPRWAALSEITFDDADS